VLVPEPFHNQRETSGALTLWHRGYCLNEIGTGKTLSAMWAADYLMDVGMIRRAFVTLPLSTIQRVWGDAVFAHFRKRTVAILHGTAAKRRKLLAQNHDFYVINHEALDIVCEVKKKIIHDKATGQAIGERVISADLMRDDIDLFIIDELGNFRSSQTKKWRILKNLIKPRTWAWGLTGTPCPNEPSDAWAQCKLLTPWTVPDYFTSFKQMTMQKLTEHIWIPLPNAMEVVYRAMQPAIRFERDQCFDLPPCTYSTREVELTDEQKKHYKEIAKELFTEINGGRVVRGQRGGEGREARPDRVRRGARQRGERPPAGLQAAGGLVTIALDRAGRPQGHHLRPVPGAARDAGRRARAPLLGGDDPRRRRGGKRNSIFAAFQNAREPRVLVADAGCMSHGLTLTEASTIIWYGPEYSNDIYTQANDRITRAGQVNAQHIIHLVSCEAERRLYKRLVERARLQGLLLDLAKEAAL
jgi:hypothetical protein